MHVMERHTPYVFQGVLPPVRRGARFFHDSSMQRQNYKPLTCGNVEQKSCPNSVEQGTGFSFH